MMPGYYCMWWHKASTMRFGGVLCANLSTAWTWGLSSCRRRSLVPVAKKKALQRSVL